jgi:predicted ribosome-associated RNA-binding protein Tma20
MRWLVLVAACGSAPAVVEPPKPAEPTGPELVTVAPGATAFAIDGSDVYWLAPGSGVFRGGTKLADAGSDAHELAIYDDQPWWVGSDGISYPGSKPIIGEDPVGAIAVSGDILVETQVREGAWRVERRDLTGDTYPVIFSVDAKPIAIAFAADAQPVVGTATTLYRGSAATPVDGGARALAADGDDIFFANTALFEKYGNGPINKLGPAGGSVTAIALDPDFVYWATAGGERDPAIYRARRSKPEMELFTRIGSASQLIAHAGFLYWLDPVEGAIHRIRVQK